MMNRINDFQNYLLEEEKNRTVRRNFKARIFEMLLQLNVQLQSAFRKEYLRIF